MLHPVTTAEEHRAALARIDELMDAETGTAEAKELEALAILVQDYERRAFPTVPPTPLEAIEFRMEQMGYTQADLARLLNSRSRASEIMTGSLDRLSLRMIRKLHREWRIPAEILIQEAG